MMRISRIRDSLPNRRQVLHIIGTFVVIAVVAPFVVVAVPQLVGASHGFVVLSSSMSPAIEAGDVVIVDDTPHVAVEEGDVITFEPPTGHKLEENDHVTHRVVEVVDTDRGLAFRTKGDANEEADRALVPASNLVGEVVLILPLIGWVVAFAGTETGILALVVLPALLLIVSEVWTLGRAALHSQPSSGAGSSDADEWIWVADRGSGNGSLEDPSVDGGGE